MSSGRISSMSSEVLGQFVFKQTPGKLSTDLSGESVIMDLPSGTYSSFNQVGSVIWNALQEEVSFSSILETILEKFEVEKETAHKELVEFLDMLLEKNLISVNESMSQT